MVVFLLIGSGDIQPWATNRAPDPVLPEQTPLSGEMKIDQKIFFLESSFFRFVFFLFKM